MIAISMNSVTSVSFENSTVNPKKVCAPRVMQRALTRPINSAQTYAPGIDPIPAMTTTTKQSVTTDKSAPKFAGVRASSKAPDQPAMAQPKLKTAVKRLFEFTPKACSVSLSVLAALIYKPIRVRLMVHHIAPNTSGPSTIRNKS